MSTTPESSGTRVTGTEVRGEATDTFDEERRAAPRYEESRFPPQKVRETKPSFLTTEFWLTLGGVAALIVIYIVADNPSLDLFRTCLLCTMIGIAYIVSRGLAKSGARTRREGYDERSFR